MRRVFLIVKTKNLQTKQCSISDAVAFHYVEAALYSAFGSLTPRALNIRTKLAL